MANKKTPFGLKQQRGGTTWMYDFVVKGKRYARSTRQTEYAAALQVAQKVHAQAILDAQDQEGPFAFTVGRRSAPEITISEAFNRYFEEKTCESDRADELLVRYIRISDFLGPTRYLSSLTMDDLLRYQTWRKNQPSGRKDADGKPKRISARTVNHDIPEAIRPMIRHARHWGVELGPIGAADFAWDVLKQRLPKPRVRFLTREEKRRLYCAVRKDYRPLLKFALITGLRAGAQLLDKSAINFELSVIKYRKKSRTSGDFGILPITAELQRLLLNEYRKAPDCPKVFTFRALRTHQGRCEGERYPITPEGYKSEMQRAVQRAGLTDWRIRHDLRHTAATDLLEATGNITAVRDFLGHSEVAQTERYAHLLNDEVRKAMETRSRNKKRNKFT